MMTEFKTRKDKRIYPVQKTKTKVINLPKFGDTYEVVNPDFLDGFIGGTENRLKGTHIIYPKKGEKIRFITSTSKGSWWFINNQRVFYEGNGWQRAVEFKGR